jgi:hypothetical protein
VHALVVNQFVSLAQLQIDLTGAVTTMALSPAMTSSFTHSCGTVWIHGGMHQRSCPTPAICNYPNSAFDWLIYVIPYTPHSHASNERGGQIYGFVACKNGLVN